MLIKQETEYQLIELFFSLSLFLVLYSGVIVMSLLDKSIRQVVFISERRPIQT